MSAEKRLLASAVGVAAAAVATKERRSRIVASGTAPEPNTTTPLGRGRAASSSPRSRAPNDVSSGGPETISAVAAPTRRKPSRWRDAIRDRSAATHCSSGPAPATGFRVKDPDRDVAHRHGVYRAHHGGLVSARTVRAYVGLGANVGDAERTLAEAIERAHRASRRAAPGRLPAVRHRAGRRHRSARLPQRGRGGRCSGRPGPGDGRDDVAHGTQGART